MTTKTRPPQGNPKKPVLVNIDEQSLEMADKMAEIAEAGSRSNYLRRLIRRDYRREMRKQLKAESKPE